MSGAASEDDAGMPLWVKAFAIIGIVLLLLIIVAAVFGDGQHGPGRHLGGDDDESDGTPHTPPPDHTPPPHALVPYRPSGQAPA